MGTSVTLVPLAMYRYISFKSFRRIGEAAWAFRKAAKRCMRCAAVCEDTGERSHLYVVCENAKALAESAAKVALEVNADMVPTAAWRDTWLRDLEATRANVVWAASMASSLSEREAADVAALTEALADVFRAVRPVDIENAAPHRASTPSFVLVEHRPRASRQPLSSIARPQHFHS